jgi:hypothetical protein
MICFPPKPVRLAFLVLVAAFVAPPARAGTVLVSRESDIRASGASGTGTYRLTNGAGDFGPFSGALRSDDAAPARSAAQQYSWPELDGGGKLTGASAEGSARAIVDGGVNDAFADAQTDFDLVFRVDGTPALLTFDATLSAGGEGTTGVSLFDAIDGEAPVLMAAEVTGETRVMHETTVLPPGSYGLSLWAFARGTPAESAASYTMSLALQAAQPGATPMPLPAGAWGGLAGICATVLVTARTRALRRRK